MNVISKSMSYANGKVSRGIRELQAKPKLYIGEFEHLVGSMLRKGAKLSKVHDFAYKYLMSKAAVVCSSSINKRGNNIFFSYYTYDSELKAFKSHIALTENNYMYNYSGEHCLKFHALARVIYRGDASTMVQAIREIGGDNSYLLSIAKAISTAKIEKDITVPTKNGYAIVTHDPESHMAVVVTWITKKHAFESQVFCGENIADWYIAIAESSKVPLIDIVYATRSKNYFESFRNYKKFTQVSLSDWNRVAHNFIADLHDHYLQNGNSDLNERQYFLDKLNVDLGEFSLL